MFGKINTSTQKRKKKKIFQRNVYVVKVKELLIQMRRSTFRGNTGVTRAQPGLCGTCMTSQRTNQSRRSWLSVLPYTGIEGKRTDGDLSSSRRALHAAAPRPTKSHRTTWCLPIVVRVSECLQRWLGGNRDGRYPGMVLERALLAASQRNLGRLEEHGWGDVPASRGSLSGVSPGVLHLHDPPGVRKVGALRQRFSPLGATPSHSPCLLVEWWDAVRSLPRPPNNGILSGEPADQHRGRSSCRLQGLQQCALSASSRRVLPARSPVTVRTQHRANNRRLFFLSFLLSLCAVIFFYFCCFICDMMMQASPLHP